MTALWIVLIAIAVGILVVGLPRAWRLHKMTQLQYSMHRFIESLKRLGEASNRSVESINRLAKALEGVKK